MSGVGDIKKVVFVVQQHDQMLRRWSVGYLSEALKALGVKASVIDLAAGGKESDCETADMVVVYRSFTLRALRLMQRVRMLGPFVVFFLDDYLFQPGCRYVGSWKYSLDTMEEADALMSSSATLLSKMPFDKPKILRRSVLDKEAMDVLGQEYRRSGDVFSVGWLAGIGRGRTLDGFVDEMAGHLDAGLKDGERMRFNYFGRHALSRRERLEMKQNVVFSGADWKGLYVRFKALDLGVVVNPLDESDEFWSCKSELKFVESGAMGVPLVTSRVPPYTEFVEEGRNGFLASTPREFAEKVLLLMRDEPLSRRVSGAALAHVRENYDVRRNAEAFLRDLAEARRVVAGVRR